MRPPWVTRIPTPLAASMGLPPPTARMESHDSRRYSSAPRRTSASLGFSDTSSQITHSIPNSSRWGRTLSTQPASRTPGSVARKTRWAPSLVRLLPAWPSESTPKMISGITNLVILTRCRAYLSYLRRMVDHRLYAASRRSGKAPQVPSSVSATIRADGTRHTDDSRVPRSRHPLRDDRFRIGRERRYSPERRDASADRRRGLLSSAGRGARPVGSLAPTNLRRPSDPRTWRSRLRVGRPVAPAPLPGGHDPGNQAGAEPPGRPVDPGSNRVDRPAARPTQLVGRSGDIALSHVP